MNFRGKGLRQKKAGKTASIVTPSAGHRSPNLCFSSSLKAYTSSFGPTPPSVPLYASVTGRVRFGWHCGTSGVTIIRIAVRLDRERGAGKNYSNTPGIMLELFLNPGARATAVGLQMCTVSEQAFGSEARSDYLVECSAVQLSFSLVSILETVDDVAIFSMRSFVPF